MKRFTTLLAATAAATCLSAGAAGAVPAPVPAAQDAPAGVSAFEPGKQGPEAAEQNERLLQMAQQARLAAATQSSGVESATAVTQAVTITYNDDRAPQFDALIDRSAQIWNSSVSSINLTDAGQGAQANITYTEGNDPRGSWAMTYSFGNGEVFLDYAQSNEYDAQRIVTHETGHILGLPDNYAGPCSELMSGGGPGPSCTNTYPNAQEIAQVEANASYYGYTGAQDAVTR
ncbi:snapalysin family zinc-dependent metalloprotease [Kytococcus sedentarius]|uniref:snapalysin family zinc-dependent metalloprotease n=1 Tax=Kytococcus sedentarius TaxID=1276 RepID=UPI0035BC149E